MSSASTTARVARFLLPRLAWLTGGFVLPVLLASTWLLPRGPVRAGFVALLMGLGATLFVRMGDLRAWLNGQAHRIPRVALDWVGPFAALSFATISAVSLTEMITPLWFVVIGGALTSVLARLPLPRGRKAGLMITALVLLWTVEAALGLGAPVDLATKAVAYAASATALTMDVLLVFHDAGYLGLAEDLPVRWRAERAAARARADWDAERRAERERRRHNKVVRRAVLAAYR